jgi:hypothetical protein
MSEHTRLFSALKSDRLPAQYAALVLRESVVPCVTYLSQTLPPTVVQPALAIFRDNVMRAAQRVYGLTDDVINDERVREEIFAPMRMGGMGLADPVECAPAAFLAATCRSLTLMHAALDPDST